MYNGGLNFVYDVYAFTVLSLFVRYNLFHNSCTGETGNTSWDFVYISSRDLEDWDQVRFCFCMVCLFSSPTYPGFALMHLWLDNFVLFCSIFIFISAFSCTLSLK